MVAGGWYSTGGTLTGDGIDQCYYPTYQVRNETRADSTNGTIDWDLGYDGYSSNLPDPEPNDESQDDLVIWCTHTPPWFAPAPGYHEPPHVPERAFTPIEERRPSRCRDPPRKDYRHAQSIKAKPGRALPGLGRLHRRPPPHWHDLPNQTGRLDRDHVPAVQSGSGDVRPPDVPAPRHCKTAQGPGVARGSYFDHGGQWP